jgi:hypothetical protein
MSVLTVEPPENALANEPRSDVPVLIDEFWTAKQRAAHSLHEVSYRACFKPQLPKHFIERFSEPGERVLDPFMGRGTTLIEAALLGRVPVGVDANPLCACLARPRLTPPELAAVAERLAGIDFEAQSQCPADLLVFYHPETLREIGALRNYLMQREASGELDGVDDWIRMVALNRLTGHSPGFFSVYTLPPNQAVSVASQRKINERLKQAPPRRIVSNLVLKKSKALLADVTPDDRARLAGVREETRLFIGSATDLSGIETGSIRLIVTSPPFLDTVDYAADNWLRSWFAGVRLEDGQLSLFRCLDEWTEVMTTAMAECRRVLQPGGHMAFEVGEVRGGRVRLEENVLHAGETAGLRPVQVMINSQRFTKTSNCWGVSNGSKGTNTNRIVVFQKT